MHTRLTVGEYLRKLNGKKIAVLGLGVSNTPLVGFLCRGGARVTVFDREDEAALAERLRQLKPYDVEYCLGEGYLDRLNGFDIIFRTPFIRPDIPALNAERKRGATVTSETEVFLRLCDSVVFGVTGSDGKTTTSTIISELLKSSGYICWLGGNIGRPLLADVDKIKPSDMTVLELSSFQLQTMEISPDIAVITNISPNHLDVHKSYEEYVLAKKNVFSYQSKDNLCVLNYDDPDTRRFIPEIRGRLGLFSRAGDCPAGDCPAADVSVFAADGHINRRVNNGQIERIIDANDILIPGEHNVENYLAAICATDRYVNIRDISLVARGFGGVEHRLELVRTLSGVRYYNDSIASSPNRTVACLKTFKQKIILIAGGKDKNLDYAPMGRYLAEKVKLLILCGQTAEKLRKSLLDYCAENGVEHVPQIFECASLDDAVGYAHAAAKALDIVVLSPASTSFDRFRNFEERGKVFKELVNSLGRV